MALLNLHVLNRFKTRPIAALMALAMLAASCALIDQISGREQRYAFSHEIHVVGEKLDCVSCHESAAVSDDPGMPTIDTCQACHEDVDEGKPLERRVESLFDGDEFRSAHASRLDDEVVFSHKLHAKAKGSCGACHLDIDSNAAIDEAIAVPMARCVDCHAERKVANECATCHIEIRENTAPESHAHDWERGHGRCVRNGSLATADNCALCHTESTCIACHMDEPPQSHSMFFRQRGHGLMARMDRQNCATCHEPDSCESCHADALPMSHTGLWGSVRNTHCVSCHLPVQGEGCFTCHKSTPSHSLGAPKPDWHNAAMNCRQCHGISADLPHVDNGSDCNACHP